MTSGAETWVISTSYVTACPYAGTYQG
jgi:hypothetical protein